MARDCALRAIATAGLAAFLVGSAAEVADAQTRTPPYRYLCEPATDAMDAVAAAPRTHAVVFEDDHVRVLRIVLRPNEQEPPHIHALPSVIEGESGEQTGARFLYIDYAWRDGKIVEIARHEVLPTPGYRAVWTAPEGLHAIANLGLVEVRFTRVEIKPESCARNR